jgi:hypothetical protein
VIGHSDFFDLARPIPRASESAHVIGQFWACNECPRALSRSYYVAVEKQEIEDEGQNINYSEIP